MTKNKKQNREQKKEKKNHTWKKSENTKTIKKEWKQMKQGKGNTVK
jgi:hypothetical protein